MVIQMVARQIGEDRAGEPDIAGPVLVKPVTGRLDHGTAAAVPKHSREKLLNAVRVRCCPRGFFRRSFAAVVILHRGNQPAGKTMSHQNPFQHKRNRRLPVGARDSENIQMIRRIVEEFGTEDSPCMVGVGNINDRNPFRDRDLIRGENDGCTISDGVGNETVSVTFCAFDRTENEIFSDSTESLATPRITCSGS